MYLLLLLFNSNSNEHYAIFPLLLAAGGLSLAGSLVNNLFTKSNNQQQEDFSVDMYNRQRADALADRSFENEYNSPAEQMARLKAAGLNPNLVYGSGGGATVQSISTRQSSPTAYNPKAQSIDTQGIMSSISEMYDIARTQAQTNLLQSQKKVADVDEMLHHADYIKALNQTDLTREQVLSAMRGNYIGQQTTDPTIAMAKAKLDQTQAGTKVMLDNNERQMALSGQSIKESIERILNYRMNRTRDAATIAMYKSQIAHLDQDTRIKALDERLSEKGLTKNDEWYFRLLSEVMDALP